MKRSTISFSMLIALIGTALMLNSEPTGAPSGVTGSPGDNAICQQSGCHTGAPQVKTGLITTDIDPSLGYSPGLVYNITVSVVAPAGYESQNKGFECSPQKTTGAQIGNMISQTGSRLTSSSAKYITHSSPKTSNPGKWNFQWEAPAAGKGAVYFYVAAACTRSFTFKQMISYT